MKEKEIEKNGRSHTHFQSKTRKIFYRVGQPNSIKRFVGFFVRCLFTCCLIACSLSLSRTHILLAHKKSFVIVVVVGRLFLLFCLLIIFFGLFLWHLEIKNLLSINKKRCSIFIFHYFFSLVFVWNVENKTFVDT